MLKKIEDCAEKKVMTLMEAAHYCRLSYRSFRSAMKMGVIQYRQVGERSYRFTKEALDAFLMGK